ncbi:uncharacterized protein ACJ7VT_022909 isoform 1-T1 [Polymixia lowei]
MTSRQHVSFGTTRRSREEPQVNMETRPQIMKVGQAGLGCRGSPKKSGDLRPPHQSAACSKIKLGPALEDHGPDVRVHCFDGVRSSPSPPRKSSPECLDGQLRDPQQG